MGEAMDHCVFQTKSKMLGKEEGAWQEEDGGGWQRLCTMMLCAMQPPATLATVNSSVLSDIVSQAMWSRQLYSCIKPVHRLRSLEVSNPFDQAGKILSQSLQRILRL